MVMSYIYRFNFIVGNLKCLQDYQSSLHVYIVDIILSILWKKKDPKHPIWQFKYWVCDMWKLDQNRILYLLNLFAWGIMLIKSESLSKARVYRKEESNPLIHLVFSKWFLLLGLDAMLVMMDNVIIKSWHWITATCS